jgi:outer membrane lipoprotein-sorting protein
MTRRSALHPFLVPALLVGAAGTLAIAGAAAATGQASVPDATEIVRRADRHLRGNTSFTELTMRLVRPDWSRELTMKSWTRGTRLSLILVTAPARDRGTAFLKRGNEVWNWVPSVERVIKIPPSMMAQSWMGSDFTNDDLVKEASIVEDFTHTILGDTTLDGRACWKIRMIPKPDAAVVWGKVLIWITKQDDLELREEFYDEDGVLINEMRLSEIRRLGGRLIPTVLEMIPRDKPGHRTVLTYRSARFDEPLADTFFSEQNMKRIR